MVFTHFLSKARKYGIKRILSDSDLKLSALAFILILSPSFGCIPSTDYNCVHLYNEKFLQAATDIAISLISLILVGLSVVVAFTSREFLSELKSLNIYQNIMFVFEYTFYLSTITAIIGTIVSTYSLGVPTFYIFIFLFIYMIMSVFSLIRLIVEFGNKKAKFEINH